jgi:peptidyl-prolyl cis-trans isomerase C
MFAALINRSVVVLAALVVAMPLAADIANAQQPLPAMPQETPDTSALPASPTSQYNPGEVLKGLANPIVANVDGHPITLADIGDAIRGLPPNLRALPFEELYPSVLERLIQQQALVEKAHRMQLDLDPVVKRHMQQASDRVLENELLNRLTDESVTEEALLARYQIEYANKPGPEEADVSVILLPTEAQARKDIAEIAGGADFAAVAKRDSTDISAGKGGSLGFLRQDQVVPEVGGAAFSLSPGQVSPNPVQGQRGWFVVKVAARRRVAAPGFAEVREKLRRELLQEGVARVVKDAMADSSIQRFNMNGTMAGSNSDAANGTRHN